MRLLDVESAVNDKQVSISGETRRMNGSSVSADRLMRTAGSEYSVDSGSENPRNGIR